MMSPEKKTALEDVALRILGGKKRLDMPAVCCRVCGTLSLDGLYNHEICAFCNWHEDGTDDGGPVDCGPHYGVSFQEAQENFQAYMTSRNPRDGQRFVREAPLKEIKIHILELQEELYQAAVAQQISRAQSLYHEMSDTLKQLVHARAPASAASRRGKVSRN